jgi:hypothetical protein
MLASQMSFNYLNLDSEIIKWYEYEGGSTEFQDIRSKILDRVHAMSKDIVEKKESLTAEKIVELIKYAMVLSPEGSTGYIFDEFPTSMAEGTLFEQQLYPCTSLVYFLNFTWTTNKSVEPDVHLPEHLRREELYSEEMVEKLCNHHGYKAIKVWNAEDLDEHGMTAISNIIAECINSSRDGRVPTAHSQLGSPCFRNLVVAEEGPADDILDNQLYVNYFPENQFRKPSGKKAGIQDNSRGDENLSRYETSQEFNDEDDQVESESDGSIQTQEEAACSQTEVETDIEEINNEELITEVIDLTEDDILQGTWSGDDGDKSAPEDNISEEEKPVGNEPNSKDGEPFERDEYGGGDW